MNILLLRAEQPFINLCLSTEAKTDYTDCSCSELLWAFQRSKSLPQDAFGSEGLLLAVHLQHGKRHVRDAWTEQQVRKWCSLKRQHTPGALAACTVASVSSAAATPAAQGASRPAAPQAPPRSAGGQPPTANVPAADQGGLESPARCTSLLDSHTLQALDGAWVPLLWVPLLYCRQCWWAVALSAVQAGRQLAAIICSVEVWRCLTWLIASHMPLVYIACSDCCLNPV